MRGKGYFVKGQGSYSADRIGSKLARHMYREGRLSIKGASSPLLRLNFFLLHHTSHIYKPTTLSKPLPPKTSNYFTMESAKQAVNYVSETIQGAVSGVSKETNKEIAKDSNASVGTR